MFESVNLVKALRREKESGGRAGDALLKEIDKLFQSEWEMEQSIESRILQHNRAELADLSHVNWPDDQVFDIEHIKALCIRYRLRFLDAALFKGEIPYEAMAKTKYVEKTNAIELSHFKIMAPSAMFKLEDANKDPLLFAQIAPEKYVLIHQWGSDLSWYRKWITFPFRNIGTLVSLVTILSLLITIFLPSHLISPVEHASLLSGFRILFFFWTAVFLSGTVSYIWFAFNQQFSADQWNSKFFNN